MCAVKLLPIMLCFVVRLSDSASLVEIGGVMSPLHVAQCRATCLQKILEGDKKQKSCDKDEHCTSCWRSCEVLESSTKVHPPTCSTSQCNDEVGCEVACGFMSSHLDPPALASITREPVLKVLSPTRVEWPKEDIATNKVTPEDALLPHVYFLIEETATGGWRSVKQTTDTWVDVEGRKRPWRNLRLLVVSPNGLEAIYAEGSALRTTTPALVEPTLEEIEKNWSKMMKVDESYSQGREEEQVHPPTATSSTPPPPPAAPLMVGEDPWGLRRLSLIHQKSLVIAELSWNEVKELEGAQEYLITWELDGGGLKGHLVTDSTTVSLSLWPDTLYHIQVEVFEPNFEDGEAEYHPPASSSSSFRSHPLMVDTSEAAFPAPGSPSALSSSLTSSPYTTALLALSGAIALVSALISMATLLRRLVLCERRRGCSCLSLEKELLEDTDDGTVGEIQQQHSYPPQAHVSVISGVSLKSNQEHLNPVWIYPHHHPSSWNSNNSLWPTPPTH